METRTQFRAIIGTAFGMLALCGVATGNASTEPKNVVVFEDSFERSELGHPWSIIIPSFSIEDGRLICREVPERNHTSISRVPLAFRNGVFEFSFRLTDAQGLHFVINDQNCEEAHSGHICRVSISPTQVRISDDRDGAFRKDLYQAFRDSGRTSKRIFIDSNIPFSFDSEQWYKARINLTNDQMEVMIDGKPIGSFRSPGIAHPTKTDIGFVTKGNVVEIDDLRVSNIEN